MKRLTLHDVHDVSGAQWGALADRELVMRRTSPQGEDAAARQGAALFDASFRDVLSIRGADRVSFLQGMLTQDVAGLALGHCAPAALLTPKGGLVAEGEVWRQAEAMFIDLEPGAGERMKAALEAYVIADDVEVSDATADYGVLELWGPRSGTMAAGAPTRLGELEGVRLLVPRAELAATWAAQVKAGAVPVGFAAREAWRVEALWPRLGADMGEGTLPLEVGLDRAISYTKGCYVGQEVVARTTYRGHVNWKLGALDLGPEPVAVGAAVLQQGQEVGRVTSVANSVARGRHLALARLNRKVLVAGTVVEVEGRAAQVQ